MKPNAFRSVAVVAVLAMAGLACSAVSSLVSGDSSLLKDDFSDTGSGWGTGTDAQSSVEYANGGLNMKIFKANYFTWSNPNQSKYQDVHMEVTVKQNNSPAGFGLMCDQQTADTSYYYFAVTSDGQYVIGKSETGKDDVFLTHNNSWASSDLIPKNAPSYRIAADCGAGGLTLFVNGKQVDSAKDTAYTDGGVGLFLWSGETAAGEVSYDDFVMTKLK